MRDAKSEGEGGVGKKKKENPQLDRSEGECAGAGVVVRDTESAESEGGRAWKKEKKRKP